MTCICPKCNYVRQPTDHAPEWQCPSCQVAYSKAGGTPTSHVSNRQRVSVADNASSGMLKWLVLVLAIGVGIWFGKPLWHAVKAAPEPAQAQVGANGQPPVTLYSAEWCGYCTMTRELFIANGVQFVELDIEKTTAGYEGHKKLNGDGVPLIVVGDDLIRGYDESRLRSTLKPWLKTF